ncbi:MAG: glycosyl transferase family 1, partial [Chloroflexota bacterium]
AAVPETLGEAGIMVKRKDFPVIAELVDMLVSDKELRGKVINAQNNRLAAYRKETVQETFWSLISPLLAGQTVQ